MNSTLEKIWMDYLYNDEESVFGDGHTQYLCSKFKQKLFFFQQPISASDSPVMQKKKGLFSKEKRGFCQRIILEQARMLVSTSMPPYRPILISLGISALIFLIDPDLATAVFKEVHLKDIQDLDPRSTRPTGKSIKPTVTVDSASPWLHILELFLSSTSQKEISKQISEMVTELTLLQQLHKELLLEIKSFKRLLLLSGGYMWIFMPLFNYGKKEKKNENQKNNKTTNNHFNENLEKSWTIFPNYAVLALIIFKYFGPKEILKKLQTTPLFEVFYVEPKKKLLWYEFLRNKFFELRPFIYFFLLILVITLWNWRKIYRFIRGRKRSAKMKTKNLIQLREAKLQQKLEEAQAVINQKNKLINKLKRGNKELLQNCNKQIEIYYTPEAYPEIYGYPDLPDYPEYENITDNQEY